MAIFDTPLHPYGRLPASSKGVQPPSGLPFPNNPLLSPSRHPRVLHVAQSLIGGLGTYLEEIAAFQTRLLGVTNVRFVVPKGNLAHIPTVDPDQVVEFEPIDRTPRGLLALGLATAKTLRSFKPDVVHLHSTFAGAAARITMLFCRTEAVVLYCPHGWSFAIEAPWWKKSAYAFVERSLLPLTDAVINISSWEYHAARRYWFPCNKLNIVHSGISKDPPTMADFSDVRTEDSHVRLLFVGRHDRQKGLDLLLEAFRCCTRSDVRLSVVGAPVVTKRSSVRVRRDDDRVQFFGWMSREAVQKMIATCDAIVMPSRWEGFGLVALEAMRQGKAVIASSRGALPEIVEHRKTGLLFRLEGRSELVDLLNTLDRAALAEMGREGRTVFLERFTSDRMNGDLVSLYFDILSR